MTNRFFFYGTLMSGHGRNHALHGIAHPVSVAIARGDLYDVGMFPAMRHGSGLVLGELWEANSDATLPECLRILDMIESYRPEAPSTSLYLREEITLLAPDTTAWAYFWNGSEWLEPIESGDWKAHTETKFRRHPMYA